MVLEQGARLRLIGPAGAYFLLTVGQVFTAEQIAERIAAGEWREVPRKPAARKARKAA